MKSRLRFLNISLLRRALLLMSCLLFSWSVVSPFYHYALVSALESSHSIMYWSFKEEIRFWGLRAQVTQQRWFFDYWFGDPYQNYLGLSWLLPTMFLAQIVTLTTGIVSVFKTKRIVAAIPAATCLITTLLMVHQNILLTDSNLLIDFYQLGYWLTYPSLVLFTVNFLLILALPPQKIAR